MGAEIVRLPAWRHWRRLREAMAGKQGSDICCSLRTHSMPTMGCKKSHTTAHTAEQVATITNENGCAFLKHEKFGLKIDCFHRIYLVPTADEIR